MPMTAQRPTPTTLEERQAVASAWFRNLRDRICAELECIEAEYTGQESKLHEAGCFERTPWQRPEGGGGEMSVIRGRVFEKGGVNISTVYGAFSDKFRKEIPGTDEDPNFWASGISLVIHPRSPLVPAVHMNTRFICTGKTWFGGGADLTPVFPIDADTADFHAAMKEACDRFSPTYYADYKKWCDEYFFLPHRNEARGIGGIFYDYLDSGDWDADFAFTQAVGEAFLHIYPALVRRHLNEQWSAEQKLAQLKKRGRYAEFNLIYDRGTRFGLMTGGNTEAILMSLPPEAVW